MANTTRGLKLTLPWASKEAMAGDRLPYRALVDDNVVLLKVSAERIHAWADGKELLGDPLTGLEVVETEEEAASGS